MEQYGGIQLNPVGRDFNDTYQTMQIGLENSTLSGVLSTYNVQGVGFDDSQNTQKNTGYNPQELTMANSKTVNPQELMTQNDLLANMNRDLI